MIYGALTLSNQDLFFVPPAILSALEYLRNCEFKKLENKTYPIDGENIFMIIDEYETKAVADKKAEQHRDYIDIHYVISGEENIGVGFENSGNEMFDPYNAAKERTAYGKIVDEVNILLKSGYFAVFFPSDIHRPGLHCDGTHKVRKAFIKLSAALCC